MIDGFNADTEREAIEALLTSAGWRLFKAYVAREFGADAQIRHIDEALGAMAPSDIEGHHAVVAQIRAASKAADVMLDLPDVRLRALKAEQAQGKRAADAKPDPFATLRRIRPRTA